MASKFEQFLKDQKIDARRVVVASRQIERLRAEDRRLKLERRRGASAAAEGGDDRPATPKPRSGRPVTSRLLGQARAGEKVSGPAKTRLLRAVNRVLEQKKKDPVDLRALF